jgi:UDP-glucose 4-epimerase
VIHFAAFKNVTESVKDPLLYHENNSVGMIYLLEVLQ